MIPRRLLPALLAGAALAGPLAAPAYAQSDRQLTDLQRQVRELRAIVFQGRDTGQPVEVKPVGPDPQVVALQAKVDGMAESQRQLTGQNEVLQHDLDETRRTAENNRAEAAAYRAQAEARLARLEAQVAAQAAPPPAAPIDPVAAAPSVATLPPVVQPPSNRPPASRRAQELTARTQAGDTSRFGEGAAPPAAAADPFADAYGQYRNADYPGSQAAFEAYIAANPAGPRTPEARYWVGQTLYARSSYAPAARAYAESLKGWPKTAWAPDATVRLAQSLAEINQSASACAAVAEFTRRYGPAASAAVRTRAAAVRARAQCPA